MTIPERDVRKAQDEFDLTVGTCVVFLNKNGMEIEFIRKMLRQSLDDIINDYIKKRGQI